MHLLQSDQQSLAVQQIRFFLTGFLHCKHRYRILFIRWSFFFINKNFFGNLNFVKQLSVFYIIDAGQYLEKRNRLLTETLTGCFVFILFCSRNMKFRRGTEKLDYIKKTFFLLFLLPLSHKKNLLWPYQKNIFNIYCNRQKQRSLMCVFK